MAGLCGLLCPIHFSPGFRFRLHPPTGPPSRDPVQVQAPGTSRRGPRWCCVVCTSTSLVVVVPCTQPRKPSPYVVLPEPRAPPASGMPHQSELTGGSFQVTPPYPRWMVPRWLLASLLVVGSVPSRKAKPLVCALLRTQVANCLSSSRFRWVEEIQIWMSTTHGKMANAVS